MNYLYGKSGLYIRSLCLRSIYKVDRTNRTCKQIFNEFLYSYLSLFQLVHFFKKISFPLKKITVFLTTIAKHCQRSFWSGTVNLFLFSIFVSWVHVNLALENFAKHSKALIKRESRASLIARADGNILVFGRRVDRLLVYTELNLKSFYFNLACK